MLGEGISMATSLGQRSNDQEHRDALGAPEMEASPSRLDGLRGPIRQAIRAVEPGADIFLYGSRARGDAEPDSDWDLLILVDGLITSARKSAIRHRLYEVEWDSDEVLTSVIFSRQDWNSRLYQAMPFHQNVERDGLAL